MQRPNYRIVGGERCSRLEKRGKRKYSVFLDDISLSEQKRFEIGYPSTWE